MSEHYNLFELNLQGNYINYFFVKDKIESIIKMFDIRVKLAEKNFFFNFSTIC